MNTVTPRKPTKKAFYFPKAADQSSPEIAPEAVPEAATETKPVEKTNAAKSATATSARKSGSAKSKTSAKTKAKAGAKPDAAAPAAEAAEKPAREAVAKAKNKRAKKEKVVRDSFTMPKADYERIAALKQTCLEAGVSVKKSELLRAGLQLLEASSTKRLVGAIAALETVKTGRPAKDE
ncbi:MAG: hypothetical protein JO239_06510 [Paraburkholderia sp.]|nr:hypothetical protein [Paraburkholderia sp.]